MHNLRVLYVEVGFCGAESKLATSDNQADSGSQRNKNDSNLNLIKSGRQDKMNCGAGWHKVREPGNRVPR